MIANSFNIDTSNPKPGKPGFIFRGGRFYDGRGGGGGGWGRQQLSFSGGCLFRRGKFSWRMLMPLSTLKQIILLILEQVLHMLTFLRFL